MNNNTQYNADFNKRIVVYQQDYKWVDSPVYGVERMMLDRIGGEEARATSIVRYAPYSTFLIHTHSGGEEYLVLAGVFSDEHGSYSEGTYVRNPIGTQHTPQIGSKGATIFVKLHQFEEDDIRETNINTKTNRWLPGMVPGLNVMPLHEHGIEHVALVKWDANTKFNPHQHWGGEEIFVLEGTFYDEHGSYPAGSWIRSPHLSQHKPYTKDDGALIYVKTGHLPE
jgi:anti-sigma factor ChrR (cupin superfamily)